MSWEAYRLVYRAESPIHIGWHTLGYINLTRYYVTGKAMWGAFTANLTRAGEEKNPEAYRKYGELFKTDVLLSYFYPAIDPDMPLLPKFTYEGLKYGSCNESEFESLFIKSYGQTAILPDSNTAEDESLHESDFIAPCVGDKQHPVYFVGYIFIKDSAKTKYDKSIGWDCGENKLRPALSEIFVGGGRKYGWGRLMLDRSEVVDNMFGSKICTGNNLEVEIGSCKPVPAHIDINDNLELKGDIEPLVGREWGESAGNIGAGQKISGAKICWMPGSIMLESKKLTIAEYGVLSLPKGQ